MVRYILSLVLPLCIFAWVLYGCSASIPRIPISGELAGQEIATTVDHEKQENL